MYCGKEGLEKYAEVVVVADEAEAAAINSKKHL